VVGFCSRASWRPGLSLSDSEPESDLPSNDGFDWVVTSKPPD
jgi:hypothetical protein